MIIKNATVIDGTGRQPILNASVQVKNGKIKAVLADCAVCNPADGEEVIDGTGLTVLPGFINCHVHLANSGESNPAPAGFWMRDHRC